MSGMGERLIGMGKYRKSRAFSPEGFFECEGRGLKWLGEAQSQGGPRVVDVYDWGKDYLDIERVSPCSPTAKAAHDFGAALARMHDAGTDHFGSAPAGYDGTCYFGPLQDPVPMATGAWDDPITYFAQGRLVPMVELGMRRGELTQADMDLTNRVIDAMPDLLGRAAQDKPARVHGDLWSGNLFGMSYLTEIMDGYQSVHPLRAGWQERTTLWQLYPIAGHCVFFGGGYISEYRSMCRSLLK